MEEYKNITKDGVLVISKDGKVYNTKSKRFIANDIDSIRTRINGKSFVISKRKILHKLFPELYLDSDEIFVDVKGYEGLYQIGNNGSVRSFITNKILKNKIDVDGYCLVNFYKEHRISVTQKVHRLVAEAFVNGDKTLTVNHKDGNKTNNNANNLEYMTSVENVKTAWKMGLYDTEKFRNRRKKIA